MLFNRFACLVRAFNSYEAVFGKVINANVSVTIKHDGASIVSIDIVYVESATKNPDTPETRVEISVKYSYDIENVTIGAK